VPGTNTRMTRFADRTIAELLAALASPDPTPGGGTAAAIAGAMGTSLLLMVTGLAKSRNNTDDEKAMLAGARAALEPIAAQLTQLADADALSFDGVMAAYRRSPTARPSPNTAIVRRRAMRVWRSAC
jgi:methenyltetrahydrofolate cyclohydrolase